MPTIIERNRERTLWLKELDQDGKDTGNRHMIPQGWCDDFSIAAGSEWGPDYVKKDDADDTEPELYCYTPTRTVPNSPVETVWVAVSHLETLPETTEEEARQSHPRLANYLDAINRGEEPDEADGY